MVIARFRISYLLNSPPYFGVHNLPSFLLFLSFSLFSLGICQLCGPFVTSANCQFYKAAIFGGFFCMSGECTGTIYKSATTNKQWMYELIPAKAVNSLHRNEFTHPLSLLVTQQTLVGFELWWIFHVGSICCGRTTLLNISAVWCCIVSPFPARDNLCVSTADIAAQLLTAVKRIRSHDQIP